MSVIISFCQLVSWLVGLVFVETLNASRIDDSIFFPSLMHSHPQYQQPTTQHQQRSYKKTR